MRCFFLPFVFLFLLARSFAAEYEALCIGAPIIDILLNVDDAFLETLPGKKGGSMLVDWQTFSEITGKGEPTLAAGGSGANTAKGLARLGHKTALCGKIGSDKPGEFFAGSMKRCGVIPLFYKGTRPTARVACLITPDGQRTMRSFPGAGNDLSGEELKGEAFKGVRLVHIEGYALYNDRLTEEAMRLAKEAGCTVSFDLASHELVSLFRERLASLIPRYVDILFANGEEAQLFTGLEPKAACEKLSALCEIAVVSIGKKGCWVGSKGKTFLCPTTPARLVDSTGAGDLFASGFLHGYLEGKNLEECARLGNRLGGAVVEVVGTELPASAH